MLENEFESIKECKVNTQFQDIKTLRFRLFRRHTECLDTSCNFCTKFCKYYLKAFQNE